MGPYIINKVAGANSFYLNDLEGERLNLPVNGLLLKMFFTETGTMNISDKICTKFLQNLSSN